MPEGLNDIQAMLQRQACDFVRRSISSEGPGAAKDPECLMKMFREMKGAGYPGTLIPTAYGGEGGGLLEASIVVEEVAAGEPSLALMLVNHLACSNGLSVWADETQKRRFLPPLSSGEVIGGVALTEPEAGTDFHSIQARLEIRADGIVLNGNKCFVTNTWPGTSCYILGFFKSPSGLAVALIPSSAPGFYLAHRYRFAGWEGLPNHALVLPDCTVPLDHLIEGELAHESFERWYDGAMVLTSALAAGMARACMEEAVSYCGERRQFGKRLVEHQSLLFRLVDIATSIEVMRTSLYLAASGLDKGLYRHPEVCMLKLFATGKLEEIASSAMEMAGGYGYTDDCRLSSLYRDAKGLQLFWGSRELMRLEIASALRLPVDT